MHVTHTMINVNVPIRLANRLKVRGKRVWGFIAISTLFIVWIYTCRRPARFSGESNNIRRHCFKRNV